MSNQSYCRFQNTLQDLRDCYDNISSDPDMGVEESRARERLIDICCDIGLAYGDEVNRNLSEDD